MSSLATVNPAPEREVVEVINSSGQGGFLLVCEHASSFIPAELNDLGLSGEALNSHVAWDPGALAVAKAMSAYLEAPLVAQCVSRLVYDCNRPPDADSAMPSRSEKFDIPGNTELTTDQRKARIENFYKPFRQTLSREIDRKIASGQSPVLITIHSFTPVYNGVSRDLDIGVLHDTDARFADNLLMSMAEQSKFNILRNAPYGPVDGVTHTLVQHALPRRLMNVMFEVRNDLITNSSRQTEMAEFLSRHVLTVSKNLNSMKDGHQ